MSCEIKRDATGAPVAFVCGAEPKLKDHECDAKGPMQEIETGMGTVFSATCSVCGQPAFKSWEIW